MKIKIVALLLILTMMTVMLSSCVFGEVVKLSNNILGIFGLGDGDDTTNVNIVIPGVGRCKNHTIVPLEAIAPTCTTPGATSGQACSKCGEVIVAQTKLVALEHAYDDERDEKCNTCGFVRPIECAHTETVVLEAIAPSCVSTGRTAGEKCANCDKIMVGYEILGAVDHVYDDSYDDTCNVCEFKRDPACQHNNTEAIDEKNPTCSETGLTVGRKCTDCGETLVRSNSIPTIPHVEGDWIVDKAPTFEEEGIMHTECVMCLQTIRTGKLDVVVENEEENASEGLAFKLNSDKNSYSLVDIGSCTDAEIVIPKYYEGLPVTKIGEGAFLNKTNITSVVIPDCVLNIGNGAFRGCVALESVVLPDSITSIGEYAFYNCALKSIELPNGLNEINKYCFYGCDLTILKIPYGVENIKDGAFEQCTNIEELVIPGSVTNIGAKAFYDVSNLRTILLPTILKSIGDNAFNCSAPLDVERTITMSQYVQKIGAYAFTLNSTINYKGSASDWSKILIDPRNYQYTVFTIDDSFVD